MNDTCLVFHHVTWVIYTTILYRSLKNSANYNRNVSHSIVVYDTLLITKHVAAARRVIRKHISERINCAKLYRSDVFMRLKFELSLLSSGGARGGKKAAVRDVDW